MFSQACVIHSVQLQGGGGQHQRTRSQHPPPLPRNMHIGLGHNTPLTPTPDLVWDMVTTPPPPGTWTSDLVTTPPSPPPRTWTWDLVTTRPSPPPPDLDIGPGHNTPLRNMDMGLGHNSSPGTMHRQVVRILLECIVVSNASWTYCLVLVP